jgi:AcrR family transcriptional regulator
VAAKKKKSPLNTNIEVNSSVHPALQQRSQEKRDRLIKAGIRIFAEKGYDQARVADLAEAANISVGVFYQRFRDKRGFFDALQSDFVERGKSNWDKHIHLADPKASASQFCEYLVKSLARVNIRNIGFMRALFSVAHHDKEVLATASTLDLYGAEKVEQYLIDKKFTTKARLRPNQVYFGLSMVTKTQIVMALNNAGPFYADDPEAISEHARMLEVYLALHSK